MASPRSALEEVLFFIDGDVVSETLCRPPEDLLEKNGHGKAVWRYVGFAVLPDCQSVARRCVVLPKGGAVPRDLASKTAAVELLLETIRLFGREFTQSDIRSELRVGQSSGEGSLTLASAAFFLMHDWMSNGPLRHRVRQSFRNKKGRIDWNRTVSGTLPVVSAGRPIYVEPWVSRALEDEDWLTGRIQRWAVAKAFNEWGWMAGHALPCELAGEQDSNPVDMQRAISVIDHDLHRVFDDRSMRVLSRLRDYLSPVGGADEPPQIKDRIFLFGVPDFQKVWEQMCRAVLGDRGREQQKSAQEEMPVPRWHIDGQEISSAPPRPDIVIYGQNGRPLLLADAKYYKQFAEAPMDGPLRVSSYDLIKQHFYHYSLATLHNTDCFENIFIVPNPPLVESGDTQSNGFSFKCRGRTSFEFEPRANTGKLSMKKSLHVLGANVEKIMQAYVGKLTVPADIVAKTLLQCRQQR
jgi:hypothetical protein